MKFLVGFLFIFSTQLYAQPFVSLELNVGAEYTGKIRVDHKDIFMKCDGGPAEVSEVPPDAVYSSSGNGFFTSNANRMYSVNRHIVNQSYFNSRNFNVVINFSERTNATDKSYVAEIDISDSRKFKEDFRHDGECDEVKYYMEATRDLINGTIKVGYVMPANTWAVIIKRERLDGDLNFGNSSGFFNGAINASLTEVGLNQEVVVWGKPNSQVYDQLTLPSVLGRPITGKYRMVFTPLVDQQILNVAAENIGEKFESPLNRNVLGSTQSLNANRFVKAGLTLLSSPQRLRYIVDELGLVRSYELIKKLRTTMSSGSSLEWAWEAKATATLLSTELAFLILEDFKPFCTNQSLYLPYRQETTNVLGLKVAYFYLSKAAIRVSLANFEHIHSLLNKLQDLSKESKSYAQVKASATEFKQIKDATAKVINFSDLSETPFTQALTELEYILSKFKSFGGGKTATAQIHEDLKALVNIEQGFTTDLYKNLKRFTAKDPQTIDVKDLVERINIIQERKNSFTSTLKATLPSFTLVASEGPQDFLDPIYGLLTMSLRLLNGELKNEFESFRKAYVVKDRFDSVISTTRNCVVGDIQ